MTNIPTHLASLTLVELSPILGIFAGMLLGFYALVKFMIGQSAKNSDADRQERQALVLAMDNMAKSNQAIADEAKETRLIHEKGYKEAEDRNGHLADISIQARDQVLAAIVNIKNQNIEHQVVEHQEVQS